MEKVRKVWSIGKKCWQGDRRTHVQAVGKLLSILALVIFLATIGYAQQVKEEVKGDRPPGSIIAAQMLESQMNMIFGLTAGYAALISFIFLSTVSDLKKSIRETTAALKEDHISLKQEIQRDFSEVRIALNRKVSIPMHNAICEKQISED